jgi:hypothetical protein
MTLRFSSVARCQHNNQRSNKTENIMPKCSIAAILLTLMTSVASAQGLPDNPGPEHAALEKLVGEYTTTIRFRAKAGEAARESNGSAKFTTVLDGRFVLEEGAGDQFGNHFEARKIYGYNNAAKRYESAWFYTGSTAIMTLQGSSADGGKTILWKATAAQADDKAMNLFITMKRINDDRFIVEINLKSPDGAAGPTLETTYTRKK